jgi:hypothetical protein
VLNYIVTQRQFLLIQCDIVDRTVHEAWMGKVEKNGAFMGSSTGYNLLFRTSITQNEDVDLTKDLFRLRVQPKSYGWSFKVWRQSMHFKFMTELLISIAMVIYFQ